MDCWKKFRLIKNCSVIRCKRLPQGVSIYKPYTFLSFDSVMSAYRGLLNCTLFFSAFEGQLFSGNF